MTIGSGWVQRYNDLLKFLTGAKQGDLTEGFAPEMMAVLPVEGGDLLWNARYRGEFSWWTRVAEAATIGNFSPAIIRNPRGSGVIAMVECVIVAPVAAIFDININATVTEPVYTTASTVRQRDNRIRGAPTCTAGVLNSAGGRGVIASRLTLAVNSFQLFNATGICVLGPGNELIVQPSATNVAVDVSYWGRERAADAQELGPL